MRVQWDPERKYELDVLPYRSIQIGIGGATSKIWAEKYIESIEDMTGRADKLKKILETPRIGAEELVKMALIPEEKPYEISEKLREALKMDVSSDGWRPDSPRDCSISERHLCQYPLSTDLQHADTHLGDSQRENHTSIIR